MLTLTLKIGNQDMDIMVKEEQRMLEVLQVLKENGKIFFQTEKILVYSKRKKEYINQRLTFRQAEVYSGDILILK